MSCILRGFVSREGMSGDQNEILGPSRTLSVVKCLEITVVHASRVG